MQQRPNMQPCGPCKLSLWHAPSQLPPGMCCTKKRKQMRSRVAKVLAGRGGEIAGLEEQSSSQPLLDTIVNELRQHHSESRQAQTGVRVRVLCFALYRYMHPKTADDVHMLNLLNVDHSLDPHSSLLYAGRESSCVASHRWMGSTAAPPSLPIGRAVLRGLMWKGQ